MIFRFHFFSTYFFFSFGGCCDRINGVSKLRADELMNFQFSYLIEYWNLQTILSSVIYIRSICECCELWKKIIFSVLILNGTTSIRSRATRQMSNWHLQSHAIFFISKIMSDFQFAVSLLTNNSAKWSREFSWTKQKCCNLPNCGNNF